MTDWRNAGGGRLERLLRVFALMVACAMAAALGCGGSSSDAARARALVAARLASLEAAVVDDAIAPDGGAADAGPAFDDAIAPDGGAADAGPAFDDATPVGDDVALVDDGWPADVGFVDDGALADDDWHPNYDDAADCACTQGGACIDDALCSGGEVAPAFAVSALADATTYYRGGSSTTQAEGEVKFLPGGKGDDRKLKNTHGISLFSEVDQLPAKYRPDNVWILDSYPDTLKVQQRGKNPKHFELMPKDEGMTWGDYKKALEKVKLKKWTRL